MTQSPPEPIEFVSALVDAALEGDSPEAIQRLRAENAQLAAEHRQQTSGYDMSHTGVNSTLVNNTVLEALRQKAAALDGLGTSGLLPHIAEEYPRLIESCKRVVLEWGNDNGTICSEVRAKQAQMETMLPSIQRAVQATR